MYYMQNKGLGKAAKVVNVLAKWLNLCLSTVLASRRREKTFQMTCKLRHPLILDILAYPCYICCFKREVLLVFKKSKFNQEQQDNKLNPVQTLTLYCAFRKRLKVVQIKKCENCSHSEAVVLKVPFQM